MTKSPSKPSARRPTAETSDTMSPSTPKTPRGKLGEIVRLLSRPEGATLEAMTAASGWQTHSVRGAMSGALKKKLGLDITSEKSGSVRVYRIAPRAAA